MSQSEKESNGQRLRRERLRRNWSQEQLAESIGATAMSINRWEHDKTSPQPHYREQLCRVFQLPAESLFGLSANTWEYLPIWHVPYRRNPLFTGRENVLLNLRVTLQAQKTAALTQAQAISGLGGIGKTLTALEYTYGYRDDYAAIFWARAETYNVLATDFVAMANVLDIPEKNGQEQQQIIEAVKRWLNSNRDWLLILDNVEDFSLLDDFLPSHSNGHILLTTRAQSTGTLAHRIDLEKMSVKDGALLLLRRAKLLRYTDAFEDATAQERADAEGISQLLDGLPLALDQAGAYIEESQCSLSDYLDRYRSRRSMLLDLRGGIGLDHPQSIKATLSLSFEKVEHADPAAADLLNLCAFLHPDAIPEKMLFEGASALGSVLKAVVTDALKLDAAITTLRRYSLLSRQSHTGTLTIHRIVQAVLKDRMSDELQRQWAERVTNVVNRAFPSIQEIGAWARCQQYLPHAQVCTTLIDQWNLTSPEAIRLLKETGVSLMKSGQYMQAEVLLNKVQAIQVQMLGLEHSDVAESLIRLSELYFFQGKYAQAESYTQQAWAFYEKRADLYPENAAACLNDLAVIQHAQSKFGQAEPLYLRALEIRKQVLNPLHPDLAESLNNLAFFYYQRGIYSLAEPLYQQALEIYEQVSGQESYETARGLNNLAMLYYIQGQYEKVEPLHLRALDIHEKVLGPEHPNVAFSLSNLATLYHAQGRYGEVEPLYLRALAIREKVLGLEHPDVATTLSGLALHYSERGDYDQAEHFSQRALSIREKAFGPKHPRTAQSLKNLATLYTLQGKYMEAEKLYQKTLDIQEKFLDAHHPEVAETLEKYADLFVATKREDEARHLKARAEEIRIKATSKDVIKN